MIDESALTKPRNRLSLVMPNTLASNVLTATQMLPAIGQIVLIAFHGLSLEVKVLDVKHVYGRARLNVTPLAGDGRLWVETDRVLSVLPKV